MNFAEFNEAISYNPLTGELHWKIRPSNNTRVGDPIAVTPHRNGYGYVVFRNGHFLAHRVAWLLHYGTWPDGMLDHRDTNKMNNRIDNLRIATKAQNQCNTPSRTDRQYKGVRKVGKRWKAQIKKPEGGIAYLGYFDTEKEAAQAFDDAAVKMRGEFAYLNIRA